MSRITDRLKGSFQGFASALDGVGRMAMWALLSLLVLAVIAIGFNPAKVGSYLWIVSKLSLAAVLGWSFDRSYSPEDRPSQLEGIERAMAQTRRATLMAACIIAAGLMP